VAALDEVDCDCASLIPEGINEPEPDLRPHLKFAGQFGSEHSPVTALAAAAKAAQPARSRLHRGFDGRRRRTAS